MNDKTTMPPPADIVKVAIEWPGANAQLIEMDQVGFSLKYSMISQCVTNAETTHKWTVKEKNDAHLKVVLSLKNTNNVE